ncbi:hypothetical protein BGZ76_002303 [Entomortierella beljakovae]|nr:hypothetical protein BGZ76_002303 [Entomortierella beljakovae]
MSNPMFDDFIELDLLDTSETNSEMFSYYLGGAPDLDDNATDLGAAAAALVATPEDMGMDLVIKQEDVSDSQSHLLLNSAPLSQSPLELATNPHQSSLVYGDSEMSLVIQDQLTIVPQATTVSLATISLSTVSTAAAEATSISPNAISIIPSSKSSAPSKRSSPEPSSSPRKHAKTESVSKSKSSSSSRKSSTSSTSSTTSSSISSKPASPTKSTAAPSIASDAPSKSPEPSTESLTSTANTTLSPATLQFLLQQQEETPLIPQLFTGKLSREEIEATLARLLESTKHLITSPDEPPKIKEEAASDDESDLEGEQNESSEQTHGLKTQPGIKTDDIPSSTDLKKMTSKERRQLRNKISARNFRVRRKEYIFTLEGQVLQHKTEARHLREAVTLVQEENLKLKGELEQVRRQLAETTIANSAAIVSPSSGSNIAAPLAEPSQLLGFSTSLSPLSKEGQSLLTSLLHRNVPSALNPNAKSNATLTIARPQSPILTPNLHKDVPNSSSGTSNQNWNDEKPIMVHTTFIPEICLSEEFQFGNKVSQTKDDAMLDRPWMNLVAEPEVEPKHNFNPFWVSGVVFELMQSFISMTLSMTSLESEYDIAEQDVVDSKVDSEAELDWELQQNIWALTQANDEEELTDEQIHLLYELSQIQTSSSKTESPQEDPNMIEWLYESMMARLVDMDLQSTSQDQSSYCSFPDARMA